MDGERASAHARTLLVAVTASTAGISVALISATGITTAAGGLSQGAIYSGIYLAITMIAGAIALPFAPHLAHRYGTRRVVLALWSTTAAAWSVAGALVIMGAPALWVVLVSAPITGASSATAGVLARIVYRAYLPPADYTAVAARLTVWTGLGWGAGALIGGIFLNTGSEGVGLVAAALTRLPILAILGRSTPTSEIPSPKKPKAPWREMREALTQSRTLRRTTMMGVGMALFVTPAMTLSVPIAQSLRHAPLYQGAGILMVGYALGGLLSPHIVSRLPRTSQPLINSTRTGMVTGALLLTLGIISGYFSFRTELALWAVIAIGIGAFRYASKAFSIGSAAQSRGHDNAPSSFAAMSFACGIAGPIGVLAWSLAISDLGAGVAAAIAGIAFTVICISLLYRTTHAPDSLPTPTDTSPDTSP